MFAGIDASCAATFGILEILHVVAHEVPMPKAATDMTQMPISDQLLDVPSSRLLREPWPRQQALVRWSEELAEEIDDDVAEELLSTLIAYLAASAVDTRLLTARTSPLQRFERRLRKSVDRFNRQFG